MSDRENVFRQDVIKAYVDSRNENLKSLAAGLREKPRAIARLNDLIYRVLLEEPQDLGVFTLEFINNGY
ncbi:MAG: hypothetical protein MHMPM18_002588 [Marteilia pararefringens]